MRQGINKAYLFLFIALLLFFGCVIRSGVLVDRSLLSRYLLLSVLLLFTCFFAFRKKNFFRLNFYTWAFLLYYLWNLGSCLWAISPSEAIFQAQLVFLSFALFLVISAFCVENEAFENMFIRTLLFVLLFSFALAFYKMTTLAYYDPYKIVSVSANNNLYAGFLLLTLPLAFAGYSLNRGFWKYLSVSVAILTLFFIVIVQTRAAYVGLSVGLVISFILLIFKYKTVFSGHNISVGIVSLVILVSGILVFYSSLDGPRKSYFLNKIAVWQYFRSYEDAGAGNLLRLKNAKKAANTEMPEFDYSEAYYENAGLRVIFWKKSACLIRSNPIAGVGAGNWRLNIPSCREPANPEHTMKNYTYSQPHNEWITIITELGIAGFLLAVFVFFLPVIAVLRRIVFSTPQLPVAAVFYCSFIIGFYCYAVFDFPLKRMEHNVLLFSVLAFLLHKVPLRSWIGTRPGSHILQAGEGQRKGAFPDFLIPVALVLILIFTIAVASMRIKGEYFTVKLFRNEGRNDAGVIHYCRKAENIFYRITPNTLPLAWFEGVAWYHREQADSALKCFQRALKSTPYEVRVLNDYAACLFDLGHIADAKSVLLQTIGIDPFFDDARYNLGAIYYFAGKRDSSMLQVSKCRDSQKKTDFLNELSDFPGYPQ